MTARTMLCGVVVAALVVATAGAARAYDRYSVAKDATNCRDCHGNFRAGSYISQTDGTDWGNLHDLHRDIMLSGDCSTCHPSGGFFPVMIASSAGGDGLDPIACMGCHGRVEDDVSANPEVSVGGRGGRGAGLRRHHWNAGVEICGDCHLDADPAGAYTPVAENVLPPYYADPGTGHENVPVSACNESGSEDFAGAAEGLDNDGDDVYDVADSDCASLPDAGVPDAGVPDAAIADAGAPDAGGPSVPDAGGPGVPDAGGPGAPDAGVGPGPDAGIDGGEETGGCGCRAGGRGGSSPVTVAVMVLAAAIARRRRRG